MKATTARQTAFWRQRLAGMLLCGAMLAGSGIPPARAQEEMAVSVVTARKATLFGKMAVIGSLAAREEIEIHSYVMGREIREVLVEVGQRVEQGEPLARLDMADARMQLDKNSVSLLRAKAAIAVETSKVAAAEATATETRKRLARSQALNQKGALATQVLEEHQGAQTRAVAELDLARQSLALARADEKLILQERQEIELIVERSTVRAPGAGTVLVRNARVGLMTSGSGSPLFVLAADGDIEFVASVPETLFAQIREGMSAEVVPLGGGAAIGGTVRLKDARLDPRTRSGTVHIALPAGPGLVPGMFARSDILADRRTGIVLPATAVNNTGGLHTVQVVRQGVVSTRRIAVGLQQDGMTEITAGLAAGELVVLKAGSFLKDNTRITPVSAGALPEGEGTRSVSLNMVKGAP
jgi:RND family efflux transporter MFP subunit